MPGVYTPNTIHPNTVHPNTTTVRRRGSDASENHHCPTAPNVTVSRPISIGTALIVRTTALQKRKSMSLKYEPSSEPLENYVKIELYQVYTSEDHHHPTAPNLRSE